HKKMDQNSKETILSKESTDGHLSSPPSAPLREPSVSSGRLRSLRSDAQQMANAYSQIYSLVKTIREINEDYCDDVVVTLLEQLGTFSSNADFRSLLLQSDVTRSLIRIFLQRNRSAPEVSKIVAKCLTNLTYENFKNKLIICRKEAFLDELNVAIEGADKALCLHLIRLLANLAFEEKRSVTVPLRRFVPTLCKVLEKAYNKKWKRLLWATLGALWNMSSHSMENKEVICKQKSVVQLLILILDEKEVEIVKNVTGVLHYLSDEFVLNYFAHKSVIETFDLIPRLTSILLSSRSPHTVLNALAILTNLTRCGAYRKKVLGNEDVFFRLQALRNASDKDICKASARLLEKIYLQDGSYTPVEASFKHVVTSTPRTRNSRSRLAKDNKISFCSTSVTQLGTSDDIPTPTDSPDLAEISQLYSKINKSRNRGNLADKSYGDLGDSDCIRMLEEEVRKSFDASDQSTVTVIHNGNAMTSGYVYLSDVEEPPTKPKKSVGRFFRRLLKFKFLRRT
uniref:Armadillo repeat-containing protein 5 n=1 Tax=Steinernema glaseri TaxID=37863 RepID=A0A1I8A9C8_9BILA